ncbi:MAG: hypothetical protein ACUVUC_06630 [Thermoguttaceae bacterium]
MVEPAGETLSPGQALSHRVYLLTPDGERIDRTPAAQLASSDPDRLQVSGQEVRALAPGRAELSATLPESSTPGRAIVSVGTEAITDLIVEPAQIALSVGERARLRVLGRSSSGTRELFPQDKLKIAVGGASPQVVCILESQEVEAVAAGTAELIVTWDDRLRKQVPVTVSVDEWTGLEIEPRAATIHPGQRVAYVLSALRGGRRRPVGPQDGLRLSVADPQVAEPAQQTGIRGTKPGRTKVVAQLGRHRAEADLEVIAGSGWEGLAVRTLLPGAAVTKPDGRAALVGPAGVIEPQRPSAPVGAPPVAVSPRERLWIEPPRVVLPVGSTTPRLAVMVRPPGGAPREMPAVLESLDLQIIAPADQAPGRFVAKAPGRTQVRALCAGQELYADVTVTASRFTSLATRIADQDDRGFRVLAELSAPAAEGPLEYRVYVPGQAPPAWVPAQQVRDQPRVVLQSPRLPTGPPSTVYRLMFEARSRANDSVQQYPFTFRLAPVIERIDNTRQ